MTAGILFTFGVTTLVKRDTWGGEKKEAPNKSQAHNTDIGVSLGKLCPLVEGFRIARVVVVFFLSLWRKQI